nr:MAG: DNA repair protein Rad51 [uncultured archaeon]
MDLLEKAKASKKTKPTLEVSENIEVSGTVDNIPVKELTPKEAIKILEKEKKKLKIASTPKTVDTPTKKGKGRVFAWVGKHGTGKTYACCDFAKKWQKSLYLDGEYKASEILDEQYPDLKYDMKEPIIDKNKKHSQIFKDSSDIHIDVVQVINETTGKRDDVASVQYIIKNTPLYIALIKSGKYKNVIIDSCTPIWNYALKKWLNSHKGRERPNKFEWQDIEAIKQNVILPFVNYCKIYNVNLILTFGISGHYVNDISIGYKEDAKQWLLNIFSYELWFEYDYSKYCLKHPYRPFWCIKDEDLSISEYLFDKEFINEQTEAKEFEDFKYESMTSETYRKEVKKRGSSSSLTIG